MVSVHRRSLPCAALLVLIALTVTTCKRSSPPAAAAQGPRILVQVAYPGAGPAEVEQGLAMAIEEMVAGLDNVVRIVSRSLENMLLVEISSREGTDEYVLRDQVRAAVERASQTFPAGSERPVIWPAVTPMTALVALTGDLEQALLQGLAEDLRDELTKLPGVRSAQVLGRRNRRVLVEVSAGRLQAHGLTASGLASSLTAAAVDPPGGQGEFLIRTAGRTASISELGKTIIQAGPAGRLLYLQDLATIRDEFQDPAIRVRARHHGVALALHLAHDKHGTLTFNRLPDVLTGFAQRVPPGVELVLHSLTPRDARRVVLGRVQTPAGTSPEETERILGPLYEALDEAPGQQRWLSLTGAIGGLQLAGHPDPGQALFLVSATTPKAALATAASLKSATDQQPGLRADFRPLAFLLVPGSRLEALVSGPDLEALARAADQVEKKLRSKPQVAAVWKTGRDTKPELDMEADRDKLARLGLTTLDVASAVRMATQGQVVQRIQSGREEVEVVLQVGGKMDSPEELNRISVSTPGGIQVPLGSVVSLTRSSSPAQILRIDRRRTIRIQVDLDKPVNADELEAWNKQLGTLALAGVQVRLTVAGTK